MTAAFGFSRFLNPRVNSSTNPILRLWLASCFSSAAISSWPEPPEQSGGGGCPATIMEGRAEIFADESNSVFYNKAQVNNRDISIAVLRSFISKRCEEHDIRLRKGIHTEIAAEQLANESDPVIGGSQGTLLKKETRSKAPKVLEALAASGLRAIRYALEVDGIGEVIAVDNNEVAIEACKKNIHHNGSLLSSKVDLDPYGSPAAFLDSAVQCVADGGILMCSATDMAVLAGGNAEVCFSKYGSYPLRGKHCHEMALRILLACIESHAIRHKRYIVPIISVHMDFYIRVFVQIFTSASTVKSSPLKLAHIYQCVGCNSFHLQNVGRINSKDERNIALPNFCPTVPQECSECGHKFAMGGPIWSDPIHDKEWATSILSNIRAMSGAYPAYAKISAILTSVSEVKSQQQSLQKAIASACNAFSISIRCRTLSTCSLHDTTAMPDNDPLVLMCIRKERCVNLYFQQLVSHLGIGQCTFIRQPSQFMCDIEVHQSNHGYVSFCYQKCWLSNIRQPCGSTSS